MNDAVSEVIEFIIPVCTYKQMGISTIFSKKGFFSKIFKHRLLLLGVKRTFFI